MNNLKLTKIFIFTLCVCFCWTRTLAEQKSQQESAEPTQMTTVGRENPFEKISGEGQVIRKPAGVSTGSIRETPELFVETVNLKFLDAKNLGVAMANMSSSYGAIATNPQSNSLIICDTRENLDKIIKEVKKADTTPPQILIEVVIIDVQLNDDAEVGVNWDFLSTGMKDSYRQNFNTRVGSTIDNSTTRGNATVFNTTGLGGDVSIVYGNIRNVIHMLQEKRDVEIIASPRVLVVSGQEAMITSVEEIPYNEIVDTSAGGSMSTTQFKDVGVKLTVSATLTDEENIHMKVYSEEKVSVSESSTGVPVVDARTARTSLLLEDGQVVIMGGLRRKELTKNISQVPIVGDIPGVGLLFKTNNTVIKNSELIVFLSPHIYKSKPLSEKEMDKFNEIRNQPILTVPHKKGVKSPWWPIDEKFE